MSSSAHPHSHSYSPGTSASPHPPPRPQRAEIQSLIDGVTSHRIPFALVHAPPHWPFGSGGSPSADADAGPSSHRARTRTRTHIAILDSSYNPPTLAHCSIASSSFPQPYQPPGASPSSTSFKQPSSRSGPQDGSSANQSSSSSSSHTDNNVSTAPASPPYTARLLLLSARNVEKTQKSSDASPLQRVEMMLLQARAMASSDAHASQGSSDSDNVTANGNVAVGLINDPTFVGKASIIREWLEHQSQGRGLGHEAEREGEGEIDLTFLVGTDTLVRVFDPRFYPEGQMGPLLDRLFRARVRAHGTTRMTHRKGKEIENDGEENDVEEQKRLESEPGLGAYLVSARRGASDLDRALEREILSRDGVRHYVEDGRVRLLPLRTGTGDQGAGLEEVSSTLVRGAVGQGNKEQVRRLVGDDVAEYIESEGLYRA